MPTKLTVGVRLPESPTRLHTLVVLEVIVGVPGKSLVVVMVGVKLSPYVGDVGSEADSVAACKYVNVPVALP